MALAERIVAPNQALDLIAQVGAALPSIEASRLRGRTIESFTSTQAVIQSRSSDEPLFCFFPDRISASAAQFRSFPGRVLYAVKCNPHPYLMRKLFEAGISDFDVASETEMVLVDELFGRRAGQYFNNPAKSRAAIRAASRCHDIRFYTVDCEAEIEKVIDEADRDGGLVIAVRVATRPNDARYALSTKFGASASEAERMLRKISLANIKTGISFHVGSQCLSPNSFSDALHLTGQIVRSSGVGISVLNVGGGFPAPYPGDNVKGIDHYFARIIQGYRNINIPQNCLLLCEPGRSLAATAGSVLVQVVMRRGDCLFLNDGVFGTLQELVNPQERRPVRLIRPDGGSSAAEKAFKVYGPTCDSNDVLGAPFLLPGDTREGDWLEVGMMGAYSLSMRTRFNGFHTDRIVEIVHPVDHP